MTKFDKFLFIGISESLLFILAVYITIAVSINGFGGKPVTFEDMLPMIIVIVLLAITIVVCIIGCVKHKNDPENALQRARAARLARVNGRVLYGLPVFAAPLIEINLFKEKIEFSVYANTYGSERKNYDLKLYKVTHISKKNNTSDSGIWDRIKYYSKSKYLYICCDIFIVEYSDDNIQKQIVIAIEPCTFGASKFIREFKKLTHRSCQPIEL